MPCDGMFSRSGVQTGGAHPLGGLYLAIKCCSSLFLLAVDPMAPRVALGVMIGQLQHAGLSGRKGQKHSLSGMWMDTLCQDCLNQGGH